MSARNGDRARAHKNRKRKIYRRMRVRELRRRLLAECGIPIQGSPEATAATPAAVDLDATV